MHFDPRHNAMVMDLEPQHVRSWSVRAPLSTHWKPATCAEFECDEYMYGFSITLLRDHEKFEAQYHYITHDRSRRYSMQQPDANRVVFVYGPGNAGMGLAHAQHKVPIGRPPLLLVADGDWRGNPRGTPARRHVRVEDWIDDSANHLDKIRTAYQKG